MAEKTVKICDICNSIVSKSVCIICGKDICESCHRGVMSITLPTRYSTRNYELRACMACYLSSQKIELLGQDEVVIRGLMIELLKRLLVLTKLDDGVNNAESRS